MQDVEVIDVLYGGYKVLLQVIVQDFNLKDKIGFFELVELMNVFFKDKMGVLC